MGLHRVPATIQLFLGRNVGIMRTTPTSDTAVCWSERRCHAYHHPRSNKQIAIQYVPGIIRIWYITPTWYHKVLYIRPRVKKADVGTSHETENQKENVGVRTRYVCT